MNIIIVDVRMFIIVIIIHISARSKETQIAPFAINILQMRSFRLGTSPTSTSHVHCHCTLFDADTMWMSLLEGTVLGIITGSTPRGRP
jgi:hypothetical protein